MLLGLLKVKISSRIIAKKSEFSYPKLSEIIDFDQVSFRKECLISLLPAGLLSPCNFIFFFNTKNQLESLSLAILLMLGRILRKQDNVIHIEPLNYFL